MKNQDMLPADLLWQDDGHVTDVVVDTLADGQDEAVPEPARDHVEACELCTLRLGDALLLTMQVGEAIHASVGQAAARPWPVPVPAMLAAVLVAVLGTVPALGEVAARLTELAKTLVALLPNLTHAALALSRTGQVGSSLTVLSMAAVAVLLVCGLAIARALPRETPLRGGAR